MVDEQQYRKGGCGCLGTAALTAVLVLAAGALGVALYAMPGGIGSRLRDSVALPPAVTQVAEEFGSDAATSARAVAKSAAHAGLRTTYPRIVPTAGKAVVAPTEHFMFDGVRYAITPHVATEVYWGAKHSTRLMLQLPGESNADWTNAYYHTFADDAAQAPAIDDVVLQLRAIRDKAHLNSDQYLELIAKYVQSIPYDWAMYSSGTGKQRFPVETLVDDKGLCGDKSVLLADLLSHEGYSAALLDFGPEKHMAVAVSGSGQTYASSQLLFLETTSPCYVTDVPTEYSGGMRLHSEPIVIAIGSGTGSYNAAGDIATIVTTRDSAQAAADALYRRAKGESLTSAQVAAVNRKLNQAYHAQTSLRSNVVDRHGKTIGAFLDRTAALRWIRANAWWVRLS